VQGRGRRDHSSRWTAVSLTGDITQEDEVQRRKREFAALFDGSARLDTVVNCAGSVGRSQVTDEAMEEFLSVLLSKTSGPFLLAKHFGPVMGEAEHPGDFIHISSLAANLKYGPMAASAAYAMANSALEALSRCLAGEFGRKWKVQSNVVVPGPCHGKMVESMGPEALAKAKANALLGDIVSPVDVANLVWFLASELTPKITGQVIGVDGGL